MSLMSRSIDCLCPSIQLESVYVADATSHTVRAILYETSSGGNQRRNLCCCGLAWLLGYRRDERKRRGDAVASAGVAKTRARHGWSAWPVCTVRIAQLSQGGGGLPWPDCGERMATPGRENSCAAAESSRRSCARANLVGQRTPGRADSDYRAPRYSLSAGNVGHDAVSGVGRARVGAGDV